jgi:hypothetical protein
MRMVLKPSLVAMAIAIGAAPAVAQFPTISVTPGSGATVNTLPNAGQATKANSLSVTMASDQGELGTVRLLGSLPAFASTPAFSISGSLPAFAVPPGVAQSGSWNVGVIGTLPAFGAVPTFKIDQSTPGTTNLVQIGATLPAFAAPPTVNLGTLNGAASAANQPSNASIGSTTSGQTGNLQMGAVTGSAPVYTSGQTNPLSLTTAGALRTDSSSMTQPISVTSLPLPSGAATAAKQPAPGTAGTPSADVLTVQGATSMTALKVDGSSFTQPVSGTVTANAGTNLNTSALALENGGNLATLASGVLSQGSATLGQKGTLEFGAVTTSAPTYTTGQSSPLSMTTAGALRTDGSATTQPVSGVVTANLGTLNGAATEATTSAINAKFGSLGQKAMVGSAPVVIASDQSAVPTKLQDGAGNALTSKMAGAERAVSVAIVDGSGNQVTAFGGSGGTASTLGSAVPTQGTAVGFQDIAGNLVTARTFNLNTGGSQQVLGASLRRSAAGGSVEVIGQTTMANSLPIAIASDQSAISMKIDQTTGGTTNRVQAGKSVITKTILGSAQTYTVSGTNLVSIGGLLTIPVFENANQGGTLTKLRISIDNATALTPNLYLFVYHDIPTSTTCTNGSNFDDGTDSAKLVGIYNMVPAPLTNLSSVVTSTHVDFDLATAIVNTNTNPSVNIYACLTTGTTVTLGSNSISLLTFVALN